MNWDDLRIILAVQDSGTFAGAAARLRINETTVARRLARLQKSLGVTLFDAADGVRKPTGQCEAILARARAIERQIAEVATAASTPPGVSGRFRIASTNSITEEILAPRAADFLMRNPGITLHFMTSNENVNLSRWQADFAIRLRKPEKGEFTITKLADVRLYLFQPVNTHDEDVRNLVCAYPSDLDLTPESRELVARGLQSRARCVTGNIRAVRALVQSQACTGILPEYLCRDLLNEPRLTATLLNEHREAWFLIQQHLKRNPAARLVMDWVRDCFGTVSEDAGAGREV